MCTVSFIPVNNGVLISSNRDEQLSRPAALTPCFNQVGSNRLLFPRDQQASGTWIAIHENGGAAVLFNGAFRAHIPQYPYRKSRGLVFLDLMDGDDFQANYAQADLKHIEPFTILFYQHGKLWENRWDGKKKWTMEQDPAKAHSWASATLYNEQQIQEKDQLLKTWLSTNPNPDLSSICRFHAEKLALYPRPGMCTVSTTCLQVENSTGKILYLDLVSGEESIQSFEFSKTPAWL